MEKTISNNVATKKSETKKPRSGKKEFKDRKRRKQEMLRVVIRQLPPTITKEDFLSDISPLAEHTQFYMARGWPEYKEYNYSRVYITFKKFEDVLSFKDRFDGYVFVNDKGHEYTAIVEFAPLQKMPEYDGLKVKKDPKLNTIESDQEYVEFLENLKQPAPKSLATPDTILEEIQNRNAANKAPQMTPLMEFILQRREDERRKKDEKRRRRAEEKRNKKKDIKVKEVKVKEVKPKEIKIKPKEVKPKEVKPKEVKPKEVKPKEVKPKEVKPKEVKPREVKPKEVKPKEVKIKEKEKDKDKTKAKKPTTTTVILRKKPENNDKNDKMRVLQK